MKTDKLFLDRWMGHALSEDYVAWAVELLVEGRDTPSLRILAGEDSTEWQDIERYFLLTCKELNLEPLKKGDNPRDAVPLVRQLYQSGTFSPNETLRLMSNLYERSNYSDPLLSLWFGVQDGFFPEPGDLSGGQDSFFPGPGDLLKEWIDREWELFDLALDLEIPKEFYRFCLCENCRHIGTPKAGGHRDYSSHPPFFIPAACKKCGDNRLRHMGFADVQEDYFSRLREV